MAMVSLPSPIPLWNAAGTFYLPGIIATVFVIDAASEKAAVMFQAPKTGTINRIGFYVGAHTTGATLDCEVQTVSTTTIFPSGTKVGSSTTGTVATTATGWYEATLSTGAAVNKGDRIALVVAQPASSPGNCAIGALDSWVYDTSSTNYPAGALYTSSWAAAGSFKRPIIFPGYDDSTYGGVFGSMPVTEVNTSFTLNTGSTPDEVGNVFTTVAPLRIVGARVFINPGGDSRDFTLKLYDSANSVLASETFDSASFHTGWTMWADLLFDAGVDTTAGLHRMTILPTTASNATVSYLTIPNNTTYAGVRHAMPGGVNTYWTQRTDAGSWTDTNTRFMGLVPLFDGVSDGAGGGGLAGVPIGGFVR